MSQTGSYETYLLLINNVKLLKSENVQQCIKLLCRGVRWAACDTRVLCVSNVYKCLIYSVIHLVNKKNELLDKSSITAFIRHYCMASINRSNEVTLWPYWRLFHIGFFNVISRTNETTISTINPTFTSSLDILFNTSII